MKRGGRKNFGYFSWAKPIFGKEPRPPIEGVATTGVRASVDTPDPPPSPLSRAER